MNVSLILIEFVKYSQYIRYRNLLEKIKRNVLLIIPWIKEEQSQFLIIIYSTLRIFRKYFLKTANSTNQTYIFIAKKISEKNNNSKNSFVRSKFIVLHNHNPSLALLTK